MSGERRLTRRDFIAGAAVAGAAAGAFTAAGTLAAPGAFVAAIPALVPAHAAVRATSSTASQIRAIAPVVSFHLDRPYVDLSGIAIPYVPPIGARGAEALTRLSEADLFRLSL